jgi:periplasmic protein TonB
MDFARQQRDPAKHVIGIAFVVLVHAIVIYALLTGLGKSIVEVIKKPLSATIIEEIKAPPPPPPPPKKIVEPPKQQIVQPYVPPPDIPVPQTTTEPVISAPTTVVPTEPNVIAPPPVVAPPAPPKPAIRRGVSRISGDNPTYPRAAIKAGIEKGRVVARVNIDEKGNVTEVIIVSAEPARHFDRAVIDALSGWKFRAEGEKYVAEVELNFVLKDE